MLSFLVVIASKSDSNEGTSALGSSIFPANAIILMGRSLVEHTVLDKNRRGALDAMRSTRRETKDTREVERATRDETGTLRTGSRASSARRNGNGTDGSLSKKRATQRNWTVGKERAGNEVQKELC